MSEKRTEERVGKAKNRGYELQFLDSIQEYYGSNVGGTIIDLLLVVGMPGNRYQAETHVALIGLVSPHGSWTGSEGIAPSSHVFTVQTWGNPRMHIYLPPI